MSSSASIKLCCRCKTEKPIAEFGIDPKHSDGLKSLCRPCTNAYAKERRDRDPEAQRRYQKEWRKANKDKIAKWNKQNYQRDPERNRERTAEWRRKNPEKAKEQWKQVPKEKRAAQIRRWYLKNRKTENAKRRAEYWENREKELAAMKKWRKENKGRVNFHRNKRNAAILGAIPPWADMGKIAAIYDEARRLTELTGIPHHVDHIVPLQSPWVCGLHCEANLQILPYYENQSKSNRWWPDMPDLSDCEPLPLAA